MKTLNGMEAFNSLKANLVSTSIIITSDWSLPFKIMCYASDIVVGVVLEKKKRFSYNLLF